MKCNSCPEQACGVGLRLANQGGNKLTEKDNARGQ